MINKRKNPFQPIYGICNNGSPQQKYAMLPEFPRCLDIELTNFCNFKCVMCPTGNGHHHRKTGLMSDETYRKIIDEIAPMRIPIRFIRWGEPLLHPKIAEYIKLAKVNGCPVHINTNGELLDETMMQTLLKYKLDSIKFSFQGVDKESYYLMRGKDFFDNLIGIVRRFHQLRGEMTEPHIQVSTTITYENPEKVANFIHLMENYCDYLNVGWTVLSYTDIEKIKADETIKETLRKIKSNERKYKKRKATCPEIFDKLSINWDGTVSACCSDFDNKMIVGNLSHSNIKTIWKNPLIEHYRQLIISGNLQSIELCRSCYDCYKKPF